LPHLLIFILIDEQILIHGPREAECTHCNERKAHCWPEPYGIEMKG
jgi:hypothetical protein